MSDFSDIDTSALDRIVGAADVLFRAAEPPGSPERHFVCEQLGQRSKLFRRAHAWVNLFEKTFAVGGLLLLFGVLLLLGETALWIPVALVVAGSLVLGISAIQVYRVAWQALDIAVGAYVVATGGGNDANG